jgi:hypothetical protein
MEGLLGGTGLWRRGEHQGHPPIAAARALHALRKERNWDVSARPNERLQVEFALIYALRRRLPVVHLATEAFSVDAPARAQGILHGLDRHVVNLDAERKENNRHPPHDGYVHPMCNPYSLTKGQEGISAMARAMRDISGNLPFFPGMFPDYSAPIVRTAPDGVRKLSTARCGTPSPVFALKGQNSDTGVTKVRNALCGSGLISPKLDEALMYAIATLLDSRTGWRSAIGVQSSPQAMIELQTQIVNARFARQPSRSNSDMVLGDNRCILNFARLAVRCTVTMRGCVQVLDPPRPPIGRCAKRRVAEAGGWRGCELKRITLVVSLASQTYRVALRTALIHAHHVEKASRTFIRLWGQHLEMAQVRDMEVGSSSWGFLRRCAFMSVRRSGPKCRS